MGDEKTWGRSWSLIASKVTSKESSKKVESTESQSKSHHTKLITKPEIIKKKSNTFGSIPTDDNGDAWGNDETNAEENKEVEDVSKIPLALMAPSWAGVASKTSVTSSEDHELSTPSEVIALKAKQSSTMVVLAGDLDNVSDKESIDADGFKEI